MAFSPDADRFATATSAHQGGPAGEVRLWEAAGGRPSGAPLRQPGGFKGVCFSPDGQLLLTAGEDGAVRRLEAATGKPVGEPLWHPGPLTTLGVTPDGATIVTGGQDGLVRLWDTEGRLLDARATTRG